MRLVVVGVVGCVMGLAGPSALAFGAGSSSGNTASTSESFGTTLMVPAEQPLDESEQLREAREAQLDNPEAVAERERSRTAYEGIGGSDAVSLAEKMFGIQTPTWVPPGSREGAHITKYLGENGVQEISTDGEHLLVESSIPLRSSVGSGQLAPTSFTLNEEAGSYKPANPVVPISISKNPADGVSLPLGVSVTPLRAAAPEASSVVGDTVLYPGTATDTDFLVEPVPAGVEASWQLLSEQSSQVNSLVFHLPPEASLQSSKTMMGAVEVVERGETIIMIPPVSATEANGSLLPVSYTISGDTLMTHVDLSGSVDFPVLVDPPLQVVGYYGATNGAGNWNPWHSGSNCGCFDFPASPSQLEIAQNPELAVGDYGEWYVYAPGAGDGEGAGITRVDVTGLGHFTGTNQSALEAGIGNSSGSLPVWTYNGTEGAQGASPLNTDESMSNRAAAFCAQEGGGHDGGEPGLCNENDSGEYFAFQDAIGPDQQTEFTDVEISGAQIIYVDGWAPNEVAIHNIPSYWVKSGPTNAYITGNDKGVGIQALQLEIPPGYTSEGHPFFDQEFTCEENGFSGCPMSETSGYIPHLNELATGSYKLGVYAYDKAGNINEDRLKANGEELKPSERSPGNEGEDPHLYIDHTAPTFEPFSGSLKEANGGVIGSGNYTLNFGAEDGSTSAPQSGVKYLAVYVDGKYADEVYTGCAEPKGVPSAGCFALSGSWTMEGQKYGVGPHTITVTARDWAGNESTSEPIHVTVNEAPYESLGPGAVNLKTGDYKLTATDVSIAGAAGDLTLSRSYDSRELSHEEAGPLGPQWSLSLPDAAADGEWQSMQVFPNGSVRVTAATGGKVTFVASGSNYISPAGYQTITLTKASASEYRLTDERGNATIFTKAGAEEYAPMFVPSGVAQATSAGGLNAMTYLFAKTSEGVVEPTGMLAPYPSSLKCSEKLTKKEELVAGCRALEFVYAEATKEKIGESESEWGEYKGRLKEVKFVAYEPVGKKMAPPLTVADYVYDKLGRLREEWDPQLPTPLKTIYGYDSEGHVTAITPPGQQPWIFTYGTIVSDANPGRLLKVVRPAVSTSAWAGVLPVNTEEPNLTGSAVVGKKMSVSDGKWSGAPLAYGYQWERCTGSSCVAIPGANNQSYTPVTSDIGHTLMAHVTAVNAGGSVIAASAVSGGVGSTAEITEYSVPAGSQPYELTLGPDKNVWFADLATAKVGKITTSGSTAEYSLTTGSEPTSIATGSDGNIWFTEFGANKIGKITTSGAVSTYTIPTSGSEPLGITAGPGGEAALWFTEYAVNKIGKITTSGTITEYSVPGGGNPREITAGPDGNLWFTQTNGSKIGKITTSGTVTEYSLPSGSVPYNITAGPDGNLWFTDEGTSKIGKITTAGSVTEYSLPAGSTPVGIISGPGSDLWFTEHGSNNIGKITTGGSVTEYPVPTSASGAWDITPGADGNLWFTERSSSKIGKLNPNTVVEGEHTSPAPGWTVEYNIPLSGAGLTTMTKTEAEKWGQKEDIPVEGTAIFPPDKPQSWPATEYTRATIYYLDSSERTVNVSSPAGGISTTEYDNHNNVKRALTADNRALALKEVKTAEVSEKLDTKSIYNAEGTELESTVGPEHEIKLQGGTEAIKARKQVKYIYNEEGAPSGGPYRLVTKTVEAAKLANGEEREPRTIVDSYSGQEGLGWKLHAPTSTTTNPGGLNLTHTTAYSPTTGMETETKMPSTTGTGNQEAHDSQIVYYTPSTEASVAVCQNHPQWANLPCETEPVHQPEVSGMPEIPVTKFTYNIWDEPETTKSTSGSSTRTEIDTYDAAARLLSKEISSSTGTSLPKVSYKYNTANGTLEKQSTGSGAEEKTITSEYNMLGQMNTYTDSEGNTATYEYEKERDARLTKVADPKGSQTYAYNATTGTIKELTDSAAGKFTAQYDVEGNLTSEELPNGMSVTVTSNPVREATGLTYKKTADCSEKCEWYTDSVVPSIHGQWLSQTSSLSTDNYSYDETGRLTQVQDTPKGKECATRVYAYDADGNRTSLTKRAPSGGKCATEGGETETHTYDTADRLIDTGTTYNPFGDILALPAADAGGSALTSSYYADGQLASHEQNGQAIGYQLDPAKRTRETVATGKATKNTINHYDGPGAAPSWMSYPPSSEWTRDISGVSGTLDAVQYNTETPVIQIANLHGDIVGEVLDSETATGLKSSQDTTEFGVPTTAEPLKYAWLGAGEFPTELSSGVMEMGARSYVPQLGRFLQPDPKPGGSADAYAYTNGDPLNESDPTGEWSLNQTSGGLSAVGTGEGQQLAGGVGVAAGAIMPPPVNEAIAAAFEADPPWDQVTAGSEEVTEGAEPEEEEEYEEEGEYEYASYHPHAESGTEEAHAEPALLIQPLAPEGAVPLCEDNQQTASTPCGVNVSLFSKGWHWVKKHAQKLLAVATGFAGTVVIAGVTLVATLGCEAGSDGLDSFECFKIAAFGAGFTAGAFSSTVAAWNHTP